MKKLFLLLLVVIALTLSFEAYMYATQSREGAELDAVIAFERECRARGLDPKDFDGPVFKGGEDSVYRFKWEDKNNGASILVNILFGPHYSESFYVKSTKNDTMDGDCKLNCVPAL